jgi:methylamine dehydrogenase light chain
MCNRNEGDKPIHQPSGSNDINWCLGTQVGMIYNCSTAVVLGAAD